MPVTRLRVVWAFLLVMLIFCPIRWFISVDLPTFGAADNGDEAAAVVGGMVGFVLQEGFDVHDGFLFEVSDDLFVLS